MIDAHTHIGRVKSRSRRLIGTVEADLKDLLEYIMSENLEKAVLLPVARSYPDISEDIVKTEGVLKAYSLHPEKIIPFCAFQPEDGNLKEKIRDAEGLESIRLRLGLTGSRISTCSESAANLGFQY